MKLTDLKTIQAELKERLAREAEQVRLAKETALQAKRDMASSHDLFMRAIGKVTPLDTSAQKPQKTHKPLSDSFDVMHLLDGTSYCRAGVSADVIKRLQRGDWRIQSACDLHHLTSDEARNVLASHIQQCLQQGQRCIRVIHGQGYGSAGGTPVLKAKVQSWLVQMDAVTAFVQAKPEQGGAGALVVLLG
jgi:DNA-nicking Smr family endonuclease